MNIWDDPSEGEATQHTMYIMYRWSERGWTKLCSLVIKGRQWEPQAILPTCSVCGVTAVLLPWLLIDWDMDVQFGSMTDWSWGNEHPHVSSLYLSELTTFMKSKSLLLVTLACLGNEICLLGARLLWILSDKAHSFPMGGSCMDDGMKGFQKHTDINSH